MLSFTKYRYENKTRVLYISLRDEDVSQIQVDLLSGTDNETSPGDYEAAHFLEHLNAQLTSSTRRDSLKIAQELEAAGVRWNAFTSPHRTGYFMIGPSKRIRLMIDVLLSSFYDFQMDEGLFHQERAAVIQELARKLGSASGPLKESHYSSLFAGHPRSKTLRERIQNTAKLPPEDLLDFRRRHYLASRTSITIAHTGRDKKAVMGQIEGFVDQGRPNQVPAPEFPRLNWTPRSRSITHVPTATGIESARILISYRVPYTAFDYGKTATIGAIAFLLTNGFSSRLYDVLRRRMGLIYSIGASPLLDPIDRNMSHLLVDTTTFHENTADVISAVIDTLATFAREPTTRQELVKYQENVKMTFAEDRLILHPSKWVSSLGAYFAWNQEILDDEARERIALKITRQKIQKMATKIFLDDPQITVTYGGPIKIHE